MKFYITYISKDPFALYKSIETIKPHFVLLLITEKAKSENWKNRIFEYLGRSGIAYRYFDVSACQNNIHDFFFNIDVFVKKLMQTEFMEKNCDIVCDQTNGVGILRAASLMYFNDFSKQNNFPFYITFADADSNSIRICKMDSDIEFVKEIALPINLYENKNAFEEYFKLYLGNDCKLEYGKVDFCDNCNQSELRFLETLKKEIGLRILITSWQEMMNQKYYLENLDFSVFDNYCKAIQKFAMDQTKFIADKILLPSNLKKALNAKMVSVINCLRSEETKKKLSEMVFSYSDNRLLEPKKKELLKKTEALLLDNVDKQNQREVKRFIIPILTELKIVLDRSISALYKDYRDNYNQHIRSAMDWHVFLNNCCSGSNGFLRSFIKDLEGCQIGFMFEKIVEHEVKKIVLGSDLLRKSIKEVYTNVKVYEKELVVLEADLLLMFKNGKNLVIEVKTNCEMAKKKDMDARAKNISDIMGVKSKLVVVYPFIRKDINIISNNIDKTSPDCMCYFSKIDKFWKYGLPNYGRWNSYFKEASNKKEFKLIGFDELEQIITTVAK